MAELATAHEKHQESETLLAQRSHQDTIRSEQETVRTKQETIKDEFISNVSHELRTPLTSIRGALGLLSAGLTGNVDAKAQNLLRIAVTNTDRLIRLLNDILDLERMHSSRAPIHTRRCSLRDLVRQSIETMAPMAETGKVKLELTLVAPAAAVFFDGDPDSIQQLLTNLLSNAIKFSPAAGIVQIRIEADSDSVLLRVSDQGRGIPVDKLDTVFDRFQQVETSDARQKGGTGLGLAICRTIVQQHNGSIWAESNIQQNRGPGASLLVTLPRVSRVQDTTSIRPITMLPTPRYGTVMICDDDAGIRTVVGERLRQHGYTILEASSGEQAIELASAHQVQAILLDLYMPDLSGWDTLKRLKNLLSTANIPIVILSVLAPIDNPGHEAQTAALVQGWVQKPFNEHLLLAELSRVLHVGGDGTRVLLIEDDGDLASVIIAGFQASDVTIDHAATQAGAMERCLLSPPDLLVLDLSLPDGDGFSFVAWLRQQARLRTLPLIVYSGETVSDSEKSLLQLGHTQFFTKVETPPAQIEQVVMDIVHGLHQSQVESPASFLRVRE